MKCWSCAGISFTVINTSGYVQINAKFLSDTGSFELLDQIFRCLKKDLIHLARCPCAGLSSKSPSQRRFPSLEEIGEEVAQAEMNQKTGEKWLKRVTQPERVQKLNV